MDYYANMSTEDVKRWFKQWDRTAIDETGKETNYSNAMEEMYQMFKARERLEAPKPKTFVDKLEEILDVEA